MSGTKWEYRVVVMDKHKNSYLEEFLNAEGKEGWEFIKAIFDRETKILKFIFKRVLSV